MISYSRNTLALGLIVCCFTSVFAQDSLKTATSQQKAEAVAARMKQELSLTENQTQRIITVAFERFETLKASTENDAKQLIDANAIAIKKLTDVLTNQQLAQYNQIRSETKRQKEEFLKQNPGYIFTKYEKEMDF